MAIFTCFGVKKLIRRKRLSKEADSVSVLEDEDYDHVYDTGSLSCKPFNAIGNGFRARKFTWDELERGTEDFSSSRLIGSGGFSNVYLANFPDSSLAAIKIYSSSSERLNRIYKQELEILYKLNHNNIVKFLGYCDDREEGVLVFEYVPKGTLQEKLHGTKRGKGSLLSWKNRMVIAFQLAQALEYLHDKCSVQIVHGDIKASNILLDEQLNCKLCDFGSARLGFSSLVSPPSSSRMNRMIMGSPGYTDPHYMRTGLASKKNDVYSFGIILLELITGIEALSSITGERLAAKAGPILKECDKVAEMVDPRLGSTAGGFDIEEAKTMASLSAMCLSESPSLRPSASDIIEIMRNRIESISFLYSADKLKA